MIQKEFIKNLPLDKLVTKNTDLNIIKILFPKVGYKIGVMISSDTQENEYTEEISSTFIFYCNHKLYRKYSRWDNCFSSKPSESTLDIIADKCYIPEYDEVIETFNEEFNEAQNI